MQSVYCGNSTKTEGQKEDKEHGVYTEYSQDVWNLINIYRVHVLYSSASTSCKEKTSL